MHFGAESLIFLSYSNRLLLLPMFLRVVSIYLFAYLLTYLCIYLLPYLFMYDNVRVSYIYWAWVKNFKGL